MDKVNKIDKETERFKRKVEEERLMVKRLKVCKEHIDLVYHSNFYSLDWLNQLDELIREFNDKLTLLDKETEIFESPKKLKDDPERRKNHNDSYQTLNDEHRKEREQISESTHHDEINNTTLKHTTTQQTITPKEDTIYSLNLTDQDTELPTFNNDQTSPPIWGNATTTSNIQCPHSQVPCKKTIDSSSCRTKITGIYPNGDILYGDGVITPFYHREPLWVHRRGQGQALRDSMSVLPKRFNPNLKEKKRDRTEKEKEQQRRRRIVNGLREWNLRPKSNRPYLSRNKYQIIKEQIGYANLHHLNIICLDIEMITLYNRPNKFSNKSLWTTILDKNGHLLYESLVKYPQNDIKQLNTKFHGIE